MPMSPVELLLLLLATSNLLFLTETAGLGSGKSRRHLLQQMTSSASSSSIAVKKGGGGHFFTLQEAIDSIPEDNKKPVTIRIYPGTYEEKVIINKPFVTIKGDARKPPTITWNDTAASTGSTWNSYTVAVDADNFVAMSVIFENTAPAPVGEPNRQGVAVRITGDKAAFYKCSFLGEQDTLYDVAGRHYFKKCFIQGRVDFICGNGQSLYTECTLNSTADPDSDVGGFLTAQRRESPEEKTGFVFVNCVVEGTAKRRTVYLGRAWGAAARVVFARTKIADIVVEDGWEDWDNPTSKDIFFGEYDNEGPGAKLSQRVDYTKKLSHDEAEPFLGLDFIDGSSWVASNLL